MAKPLYLITLRRNADGVERVIPEGDDTWLAWKPPYDDNTVFYNWTDGNSSCDCNRSAFFARVAGEPEDDKYDCGETKFTLISIVNARTGRKVYPE
jgi:hypothetical protein